MVGRRRKRSPCWSEEGLNRGAWSVMEDQILTSYIQVHGEGKWRNVPKRAGLKRCGKSCRLRWLNYLRPDIIRGNISSDEEELIVRLHKLLGNRWCLIAGRLPGRTDNEIKNYWNTTYGKKAKSTAEGSKSSQAAAASDNNKIQVIRTKATRCNKAMVPLTHLPPNDDDQVVVDTTNSKSRDPLLDPQDHHQSYLIDNNLLDQNLNTTLYGSSPQGGVDDMCGAYDDSDFLNFGCSSNNEFEASKFDDAMLVESVAAAGYINDNNIFVDTDKSLLPSNDAPLIDSWTTAGFDENASVNMESLGFLLDSEEWP